MTTISSKFIKIAAIASTVSEVSFSTDFGDLSGIKVRRSVLEQTTSDLAFDAASRILKSSNIDRQEIGVVVFLSRTPDYRSPNTAAVLQGRLGLSLDCICYDVNRGSNGFIVGIQLVASILLHLNKKYGLVLFGDTPSKLAHENTFFSAIESDAASAVLLEKTPEERNMLSFQTSYGSYFKDFSILKGGFRDYNPMGKFDATDTSNYKLSINYGAMSSFFSGELNAFLDKISSLDAETHQEFIHSQLFLLTQNPQWDSNAKTHLSVLQKFGNTYGSNLPLQLSAYFQEEGSTSPLSLSCISFGEGLELCYIRFDIGRENVLETATHDGFFEDYRVSHEM